MSNLLEIDRLSIAFSGGVAVHELSLNVPAGSVLGLVGESGSGKSVTALAIMRLLLGAARVEGAIRFERTDLLTLDPESMRRMRGREIAMIFQEPMTALNPVMPVGEQVAEAIRVHQSALTRTQMRARVLESFEAVGLPGAAARYRDYPHQFSGGQRQRIMIAMAIANRPRLLIADEPTTALDVTVQKQILNLLAGLRERFGLTMIFISHDLAVVSEIADRVAVMRGGLLLEEGPRQAIFASPAHPYTRALMGAVPTMKTDIHRPLATIGPGQREAALPLRRIAEGHWARIAS